MRVNILDVSGIVYTGYTTSFGQNANFKGVPTGGFEFMLRKLLECQYPAGNINVLAFDSRTNRREIYPKYKGFNRGNNVVNFCRNYLYSHFNDIGLPNVIKIEGHEADDIAYNINEFVHDGFNSKVELHCADHDWAHNIIDHKQIFVPVNQNVGLITIDNYEDYFSTSDKKMLFNSRTAHNVFFGDESDGVPPFHAGSYENLKLYTNFCKFCEYHEYDLRKKTSLIKYLISLRSQYSEENLKELLNRLEVLYPRQFTAEEQEKYLRIDPTRFDKAKLSTILSLTGCKNLAKRNNIPYYQDMGAKQQEFKLAYESSCIINPIRAKEQLDKTTTFRDRGGIL